MSKLSRWIVLSTSVGIFVVILSIILSTLGMTKTDSKINFNAGGIACLVFIIIASICEVIGTLRIWTRKNVSDITIDNPSKE